MTIYEIIDRYQQCKAIELQLSQVVNALYDMKKHHQACDATSYWIVQMINHPDWTVELADKYYPASIGGIAYPVSC